MRVWGSPRCGCSLGRFVQSLRLLSPLYSSSMMGERYDEESHCAKKPDYEPASHDHTTISAGAVRSRISRVHASMHVEPGYHACAATLCRIHGRTMPVEISEAVREVVLFAQSSGRRAFVVDHGRSSNRYYWPGEVWVEGGFVLQRGAVRLWQMLSPSEHATMRRVLRSSRRVGLSVEDSIRMTDVYKLVRFQLMDFWASVCTGMWPCERIRRL